LKFSPKADSISPAPHSSEQAVRLLILLMVLTCDPLAIALLIAASADRRAF
jgi:hypothetical protein